MIKYFVASGLAIIPAGVCFYCARHGISTGFMPASLLFVPALVGWAASVLIILGAEDR